jgi:hypothetical protein
VWLRLDSSAEVCKLSYDANSGKHGPVTRPGPRGPISPDAPEARAAERLSNSVRVNDGHRVATDPKEGKIYVYQRQREIRDKDGNVIEEVYHAYEVKYKDLRQEESNALRRHELVTKKGKIKCP